MRAKSLLKFFLQAVDMVKYHLGWKLALNLKLGADGFHPSTLGHFRQRLLEAGKSDLALRVVLRALEKEGLIAKRFQATLGLDAYSGSCCPDECFGMRA